MTDPTQVPQPDEDVVHDPEDRDESNLADFKGEDVDDADIWEDDGGAVELSPDEQLTDLDGV